MKRIKHMSRTKKFVAAGLTVGLTLGLAGAAFAFFTGTGTGSGHASVGANTGWAVTLSSDNTGSLYPGTGSETLSYTIQNTGGGNQQLTSVTAALVTDSSGLAETGNPASYITGCYAGWFTATASPPVNSSNATVLGSEIAPGNWAYGTVKVTMTDTTGSQDGCIGATPNITLSVG
jgi:hypothetical protein